MGQRIDPPGLRPDQQEAFEKLLKQRGLLPDQTTTISRTAVQGGPFPVSFEQRSLWITDQLTIGTTAYNMPLAVRLKGALNVGAVRSAMTEIVRRHDALRTVFDTREEEPVQIVHPPAVAPVGLVDISDVGPAAQEALAKRIMTAGVARRFQLSRGPLLWCLLIRLSNSEHWLLITMHHIVSDDWSIGILAREFAAAYSAFRAGGKPDLPELPVQYADFAVWQRSRFSSPESQKQLAFWRRKLDGLPELALPFTKPHPLRAESPCAALSWTLSSPTAAELRAIARRHGATLFILFVAVFKMLLRRLTGQSDIVIGTDSGGRDIFETESLIGFFVNQLVLRTDISGDLTFTEILQRVRETCLEAYAHRDMPFERLVSEVCKERTWNRAPIFQIKIVQVQAFQKELAIEGLEVEPIQLPTPPAKFDLILEVVEANDDVACALKYNEDLFDHTDIESVVSNFRELLDAVAQQSALRFSVLDNHLSAAPLTDSRMPAPQKASIALDRQALTEPLPEPPGDASPKAAAENILLKIWAEILRMPKIGIHDNFFTFGGDSILSIKMTSRARQVGLKIDPRQVFEFPTIAQLAAAATPLPCEAIDEQGSEKGGVPLTPIQRWFLEQYPANPHHFNQSVILETAPGLSAAVLQQAVNQVVDHHDAFRLRFRRTNDGWEQWIAEGAQENVFRRVELDLSDQDRLAAHVQAMSTQAQKGLDLERGPLIRMLFFDAGKNAPSRLLIVAHHLVIDGVSWRILLEDMNMVVDQLNNGGAPVLPQKTASFRYWARRLSEVAKSSEMRADAGYWLELCGKTLKEVQLEDPGNAVEADAQNISTFIDRSDTRQLLQVVRRLKPPLPLNNLLIAALARSLAKKYGAGYLRIDIEGHGREQDLVGADISRTVGWFTAIAPLLLQVNNDAESTAYTAMINGKLRSIPRSGVGYGICRYMSGDRQLMEALEQLPPAPVLFNFFGHFDEALDESKWFRCVQEQTGLGRDIHTPRPYPLEVDAMIYDGRLLVSWGFDWRAGSEAEVRLIAEDFLQEVRRIATAWAALPAETSWESSPFPGLEIEPQEFEEYSRRFAQPLGEKQQ
jgi:non-ribosomal peptide synthase protein (TIGR01720 family)